MPEVRGIFEKYSADIAERRVDPADLSFAKQLSKDAGQYQSRDTVEGDARLQLYEEGREIKAGQVVRYVITDYDRRAGRPRTIPLEMLDKSTAYDARRYVELLADASDTLTMPFGYTVRKGGGRAGRLRRE